MPHWNWKPHPEGVTLDEFHKILELRKELMRQYGQDPATPMPAPIKWRHGWKCHWRRLGRDRDGSLKVTVVIEGPRGEIAYARNYRLVKKNPLPYELGRGLHRGQ